MPQNKIQFSKFQDFVTCHISDTFSYYTSKKQERNWYQISYKKTVDEIYMLPHCNYSTNMNRFFFFFFFIFLSSILSWYLQPIKLSRKLNPTAALPESVWSFIKVMEVPVRVRGRGILGSMSSNIKTCCFNFAGKIVRTKKHQTEKQHNTIAHEKNILIKIPFFILSVDHFISKSLLHTIIKGCNFKRILQCKKYFSLPWAVP